MNPFRRNKKAGRRRGMHPLVIAAFMILVPAVIVYYAFEHSLPFISSAYTDYAIVPNSVNLTSNSPVRVAGVDVGSVTKVTPDGNATKVEFTLSNNALPLHTDATATIRDRLFLEGGYYLALTPGSPSAPTAPEGYTIPEQNTATPVQFFQLLSTFDATARANLKTLLNTTNVAFSPAQGAAESDSGAGGLKQAIPELTPDLKDTALISQALTGTHAGDVDRLLTSSAALTTTLANHRNNLEDLVQGLNQAMGALAADDGALGQSISGLDETLKATPATLTAVNRSLGPLDTLAANLAPALKQSPPLLTALTSDIREVNTIVGPSNRTPFISAFRTLLVTFPSSLTQLAGVFPPTQAVAQCLAQRVTPLLNEEVQDGALSTNDPVWKDLVHFLPNMSAASANFDANGPYLRVLVAAGTNSLPSTLLGSIPGAGSLVSTLTGGTSTTASTTTSTTASTTGGIAPQWVGDLTANDFRPDVSCTSQPLPTNLVADPSEADK